MARAIVTEEAVRRVAQELVDAGEEPRTIRVQALIGGGSFSTVRRYLDAWRESRDGAVVANVDVPLDLAASGVEWVRTFWQQALIRASQDVNRVREEARRQVDHAELVATEAEQAVGELEAQVERQQEQIDVVQRERDAFRAECDAFRAELEKARISVQVMEVRLEGQGERIADLQGQLAVQAEELAQARANLLAQAHLAGEVEALRRQVAEVRLLPEPAEKPDTPKAKSASRSPK